ncbi:MAG: hypothetical protein M1833_000345 [Piccolia ochrophora]|nr:MAG: hypothetical protein M1833_000345 [Piccolia ochrophora]
MSLDLEGSSGSSCSSPPLSPPSTYLLRRVRIHAYIGAWDGLRRLLDGHEDGKRTDIVEAKSRRGNQLLHTVMHHNAPLDLITFLVSGVGADMNRRGFHGRTALHLAAARGHSRAVVFLSNAGAAQVPDGDGRLPLHVAAVHGHLYVCIYLLRSDPESRLARDRAGRTALDLATHYEVAKQISEHMAWFAWKGSSNRAVWSWRVPSR